MFALLGGHPELADPRFARVRDYDDDHGTSLVESLEAYLAAGMNVRDAAAVLTVHPNTLRYRVDRAQQLSGLDLGDPGDRLLTELQLGLRR
ncbi:PucR family transcriptional regulator [Corynebacterium kalidii]|uniref:Helix-turn-helix domain-containing protein n=1 Tax=Corynebacterium kalidii TaxID=2931982 RepID=A0A9X2B0C7_9CORY|nr:helix-turn-helix domain-containing protein [Corynebacterium kalidii]